MFNSPFTRTAAGPVLSLRPHPGGLSTGSPAVCLPTWHQGGWCQVGRVDDVVIYLLHQVLCLMEASGGAVRVMFFFFWHNQAFAAKEEDGGHGRWTSSCWHGQQTTSQQTIVCPAVGRRWWSAAQGFHRGPCSHYSSSHSTNQISDTTLNSAISRSYPMTQPSLAVCQRGMNRSTEE